MKRENRMEKIISGRRRQIIIKLGFV